MPYISLLLLAVNAFSSGLSSGLKFKMHVNTSDVRCDFVHFWRSTGFCPGIPHEEAYKFDLSQDMKLNLAYIGAMHGSGISQIRVHWLLDLVTAKKTTKTGPVYNFTHLDEFVSVIAENKLNLGFELMGNPSGIFQNFEQKSFVYEWRDLVAQTASRYIDRYGLEYVRQWNFETWNEPDCRDFDKLNMTVQGFLNYYDACSEGLRMADSSLTLGGPGDGCTSRRHEYLDALLNHVVRGKNYFTGETGVRLDFISLHKKGDSSSLKILTDEVLAFTKIKFLYPELRDKAFYNDEGDPLVGWNKPKEWRATSSYAAMVTKIISQHQNMIRSRPHPLIPNYALLSNDNGFLSFYPNQFTQRTLLARFQMNDSDPHYVTFVRKPVYTALSLMALLGDKQIHSDISTTNVSSFAGLSTVHEPIGGKLPNSDSWQSTVLVYGASDPGLEPSTAGVDLSWFIDPPSSDTNLKLMIYSIDEGCCSPYNVWATQFNKTDFPSLQEWKIIRRAEEPKRTLLDVPSTSGYVPLPTFALSDPQILLLHLCAKPEIAPEQVLGARFINITAGQVLLVWSDTNIHTKCLLTYEVVLSRTSSQGPYKQVSFQNFTDSLFLHEKGFESEVRGYYKIRAVDYWNQTGEYSNPVLYDLN